MQDTYTAIEMPAELPVAPPEPSGGFPWVGGGIVVVVVAAAVIGRKIIGKN